MKIIQYANRFAKKTYVKESVNALKTFTWWMKKKS